MRKDMKDVIINIPRHKGNWVQNKTHRRMERDEYNKDSDSAITHMSMRRRIGRRSYDLKSLADRLNPLRGFFRANVGRPWDKVYSELKESIDSRELRGWHLLTHVPNIVSRIPGMPDDIPSYWRIYEFYVDDKGFLRANKDWGKRIYRPGSKKTATNVKKINDTTYHVATPMGLYELTVSDTMLTDDYGNPYCPAWPTETLGPRPDVKGFIIAKRQIKGNE